MRRLIAGGLLALVLGATGARAQMALPYGFTSVPSFAWREVDPESGKLRWEGNYARASTGFEVSSSKRFGTSAGPTFGVEAGRLWRQEDVVFGVAGGFDYLAPFGNSGTPAFGRLGYTRDFAGGFQVKVGTLVTEDVLVYTRAGLTAVNGTYRFGPSPVAPVFSRNDIVVQPDARIGVEWAVTDRLTLGIEVGATGRAIR